jgi:hypothetical protein
MLTIFSTPKPFRGHIDIIQRNAIASWKRIHPDAEVILFGDDEGTAEAARDLGILHVPHVERNEHGTKYLTSIFDQAQKLARHDTLCYSNCDILLLSDFREALLETSRRFGLFLMVGQRWDTAITAPVDFEQKDWEPRVRALAREAGRQRPANWIDYFAFSRGLFYQNTPPFVIGRPGWDVWLLWKARASGAAVVDASSAVTAVHQNHDYSYHPDGEAGVWQGEEAQRNYALLQRGRCFRTIENATHRMTPGGFRRNYLHWIVMTDRWGRKVASKTWFTALTWTRPVRHRLGLRRQQPPQPATHGR